MMLAKAVGACAYLGDRARAARLYALLESYPDANIVQPWVNGWRGPVAYHLGLLAATLKRWDTAEEHFRAALALTRRTRDRPYEAHVLRAYGGMLLTRHEDGAQSRAHALLTEALALYDRLGMAHFAAKTRRLLARPEAAPAPAGLSAREVAVLRLIAAGKSNREVAERLTISVNTVFQHVRSILNKTGCTNRTEAAAYALRHGLVE